MLTLLFPHLVQILISHGSGFISRLQSNIPTGAVVYTPVWVCILCIINSIPCTVGVYMLRHSDSWNYCVWTIRQEYMYFNLLSLGDRWLKMYTQCSLLQYFFKMFSVMYNHQTFGHNFRLRLSLLLFSALMSAMPNEGHCTTIWSALQFMVMS